VPRHKVMLWIGLVLTIVLSLLSALAIFTEIK
jgi:hypothetical protein